MHSTESQQTSISPDPKVASIAEVVDRELDRLTQFSPDCPSLLADAIRYSLLGSGKRIRPILTVLACQACQGKMEQALPVACAVEMIHCYSLIHDDLPAMDDDDFRRGRPSCHKQFDEATAILAGDALQAMAYQTIAENIADDSIASRCVLALSRATGPENLVGGQVDDLGGGRSHERSGTLDSLERIHRRKTGALITVSLEMGGLVANADASQMRALSVYGQKLGLAFQIVDDLLDLQGDPDKMGKTKGKDIKQQKLTYPGLLGQNESVERANRLIDQAIECLGSFGPEADPLRQVAQFVIRRQH